MITQGMVILTRFIRDDRMYNIARRGINTIMATSVTIGEAELIGVEGIVNKDVLPAGVRAGNFAIYKEKNDRFINSYEIVG